MKQLKIVMLYDAYLEATRKQINKIVQAKRLKDAVEAAKQSFLLAMLRCQYYEQFLNEYPEHSESGMFVKHQHDNCWQLVGIERDNCDDVGFDWRNCEIPDLAAYLGDF